MQKSKNDQKSRIANDQQLQVIDVPILFILARRAKQESAALRQLKYPGVWLWLKAS